MNQFIHQLQTHPFTLLVSLPRNDANLARAALWSGARGLKVHLNVSHAASGTKFGSFEEEHRNLQRIAELAKEHEASVGIVPGGAPFATREEFEQLALLGIDYFDAYTADAPAWTLQQQSLDIMLAAHQGASVGFAQSLERMGMQMCEASILPHEDYGKRLNVADVAQYEQLCNALQVPVIVPTQKKILPGEVEVLQQAGVGALLIGAVVTGTDEESIKSATREYAQAIEKLS